MTICEYEFGIVRQPFLKKYFLKDLGIATVQTLLEGETYTIQPDQGSVFVMVMDGILKVFDHLGDTICTLKQGCHAEMTMAATIRSNGHAFLIQTHFYKGLTRIGMMLEECCSLSFIDDCKDTLLISPLIKGNPCLNFLHIPQNTTQTLHTHPSARLGLVISGQGLCVLESGSIDLVPNTFFIVQDNVLHQFLTTDSELGIFVFHPDSDFGPSNAEHPMINRSYIDGTSVTELRKTRNI